MPNRIADLTVYQDPAFIKDAGYDSHVKAICTLNEMIVVFMIVEEKYLFNIKKPTYTLSVKLHSLLIGRPYGNKSFDTYEEALAFGIEFAKLKFPELVDPKAE